MAGDWQRWYQHEIDKWQGSATVQTFSDVAYRGFHNLIMAQFQTDDGKLPNNPAQLAKLSRLGPRWAKAADEVLAEFQDDGNGRIFNATQYKAWEAARARHEAYVTRKSKRDTLPGGKPKAGDPAPIDTPSIGDRSGIDTPSIEDGSGIDNPSIDISQGIDDTKEKEKKKEKKDKDKSAGASPAPVDPVLFFPLAEGTQYGVDRSRLPGWQEAFPGVDVLHELYMMREWLIANPTRRKTGRGISAFVVTWLSRAQDSGKTAPASPATVGMYTGPAPAKAAEPKSIGEFMGPNWCAHTVAAHEAGKGLNDLQRDYIRELAKASKPESEAA